VSWDNQTYAVCRECQRDAGNVPQPEAAERQYGAEEMTRYTNLLTQKMAGWMDIMHINLTQELTKMQHGLGLFGAVGELGVHMGKYFICIALSRAVTEPAVAMDLFPGKANSLGSGGGHIDKFKANLKTVGISDVIIIPGDSLLLSPKTFSDLDLPLFRFFSVDGAHSLEFTLHDLQVAGCSLMEGGIISVDDITNMDWPGVLQAVTFNSQCEQLAPFLMYHNKLLMTTISHYERYFRYVSSSSNYPCRTSPRKHMSKSSIGRFHVCWVPDNDNLHKTYHVSQPVL